ncbi:hypothetical protein [Streptomyces sp. AN091965]|uniref:hypothetical protein n=1 Tax=Streptomyces sp. AN091965 TaxID=2927803 RepID=UPI001F61E4A0|nr:hypothetical protein [Streptomyces sp. AN091965]MCI3930288.1 hypothetical protein [Streptomyces sp. AN091965]
MTPKQLPTSASGFLLLVALLFGIVTMHTLGHPQEHGGGSTPSAHARVADATGPGTRGTGADPVTHAGSGPAAGTQAAPRAGAGPVAGKQAAPRAGAGPLTTNHVVTRAGIGPVAAHQAVPHTGTDPMAAGPTVTHPDVGPMTASQATPHPGAGPLAMSHIVTDGDVGPPMAVRQAVPHSGAEPLTARHAVARAASPPGSPSHGTGMDPMSVCLAVLGGALVLALFGAVAARPPVAAPVLLPAGLRAAPWPEPPPPRALLARLSVLRI